MHYEARVGNYDGDIGELVRQYSLEFMRVPIGNPEIHKYGLLIREPSAFYLLMISNSEYQGNKHRDSEHRDELEYQIDYNVIATLFGKDRKRVGELMSDFEKRFAISLKPAPKFLKERYDTLAILFERMKIMETLSQLPPQTVYCEGNKTWH